MFRIIITFVKISLRLSQRGRLVSYVMKYLTLNTTITNPKP